MTFFEWLGRVVMLVLAGMVTLSIIGAIAAIPNGIVPQRLGLERQLPPVPERRSEEQPASIAPEDQVANVIDPQSDARNRGTEFVPVPPEPVDPARWLETISYALLALSGLAALGCVLLWSGVRQQRRIAEALEALSAAPQASSAPPS